MLVTTPEHLLNVLAELGRDCGRVYRLHLSGDGEPANWLERICTLHQYEAGGELWFSTTGMDGLNQPCLSWQPPVEAGALPLTVWTDGASASS